MSKESFFRLFFFKKRIVKSRYWAFREKILDYERELLRVLAFNLQIEHPYKYLLSAVKVEKRWLCAGFSETRTRR